MIPVRHEQLTLDLGHRPASGREDFLIADSNRDAVSWIDLWPDWPAPALILYGPAACGKTHLAAVWSAQAQAVSINPDELCRESADALFARGRHFLIDPVDPWIGDRDAETTLFHLYNLAKENERSLLLTMRVPPVRLTFAIPDLSSRLRAAPGVAIHAPDEMLLGAVLVKMFADRQIQIGEDILSYLLLRMERSFAAARDLVEKTDRLALAEKKPVSLSLIRHVLMTQTTAE
ncbi:MAG: DNA replication protein [Micavibrio aeruginosavorus]|uniref:DNA replication protein n=1 Tax=Micavibrio aeruginosavorus TaxID=349221 RepID=A0A7T5R1V3_9BACT|nr:MAG: DNA replication protein [Micavibrio aeruginosavorus]